MRHMLSIRGVFIFTGLFVVLGTSCQKKESLETQNYVTVSSQLPQVIGDEKVKMTVRKMESLRDQAAQLVVGYPGGLIGQENLFGGVITEVSETKDESFGNLKMANLSPYSVKTVLGKNTQGQDVLWLKGCRKECTEGAARENLFEIPIVAVHADRKEYDLDFSKLGSELNIMSYLAGEQEEDPAHWSFQSSVTRAVDYSVSTLVFDVVSEYKVTRETKTVDLKITTRWYLKLSSALTPDFISRQPLSEVGFFTTSRNIQDQITRFAQVTADSGPLKYYLKNVPALYRQGFIDGFEDWNKKLEPLFKTRFVDYEFLEASDPRSAAIVAGDIRYNVLEWDLVNLASYGGLGPSIAHQKTGEILAAQVLVQGPVIEELYKSWFFPSGEKRIHSRQFTQSRFKVQARGFDFVIPAQDPRLQDRLDLRMDFEAPPAGYTYESYMQAYFHDMISHELGHNFGLRHNFKGNLGSNDQGIANGVPGSVSRSIMEYLNASFRHLDTVGEYDVMAINYGYFGVMPQHKDWFCTDENADESDPESSAECSSSDATQDPFGYLQSVLQKVFIKTVNLSSVAAPDWKAEDLAGKLTSSLTGMVRYASTAVSTADTWVQFFGYEGRPKNKMEVPGFVLKSVSSLICNKQLDEAIAGKESVEAQEATRKNLAEVRKQAAEILSQFKKPFPIANTENFSCLQFEKVQ